MQELGTYFNEKIADGIQMAATRFAGVSHNGPVYAPTNPFGNPGVQKRSSTIPTDVILTNSMLKGVGTSGN